MVFSLFVKLQIEEFKKKNLWSGYREKYEENLTPLNKKIGGKRKKRRTRKKRRKSRKKSRKIKRKTKGKRRKGRKRKTRKSRK